MTREQVFNAMVASGYNLRDSFPWDEPKQIIKNGRQIYNFGIVHEPGGPVYVATFGPRIIFENGEVIGYDHSTYECYAS